MIHLFFGLLLSANGFIIIRNDYRLANADNVIVNIASGGCRAYGVPDSDLIPATEAAINRYWNRVSESRLRLRMGQEVGKGIFSDADSGEILVGCGPLDPYAAGASDFNMTLDGGSAILNSMYFYGGSYLFESMVKVLTHEIGHAIGLSHSSDPASVMTYEQHGWGLAPSHLSEDDKLGVTYLYPREPQLWGLFPGCSALAADGGGPMSGWALVELVLIVLGARGVAFVGGFFRRFRS